MTASVCWRALCRWPTRVVHKHTARRCSLSSSCAHVYLLLCLSVCYFEGSRAEEAEHTGFWETGTCDLTRWTLTYCFSLLDVLVCVCVCRFSPLVLKWKLSKCPGRCVFVSGQGGRMCMYWVEAASTGFLDQANMIFVNNFRKCIDCMLSDIHSLVHHISQTSRGFKVFCAFLIELSLVLGLKGWN